MFFVDQIYPHQFFKGHHEAQSDQICSYRSGFIKEHNIWKKYYIDQSQVIVEAHLKRELNYDIPYQ